MATLIDATCSECFLPQVIELNPRRMEIACEFCSHSVPMFERHDMEGIRGVLKQERTKMLIALAAFVAAGVFFALHVRTNSKDDMMQITTSDGVTHTGYLVERTAINVQITDVDTGDPMTVTFKDDLADKVEALRAKTPLLTEDAAATMASDEAITVLVQEPGQAYFLILAGMAAVAALVFSAIATKERLVCEF